MLKADASYVSSPICGRARNRVWGTQENPTILGCLRSTGAYNLVVNSRVPSVVIMVNVCYDLTIRVIKQNRCHSCKVLSRVHIDGLVCSVLFQEGLIVKSLRCEGRGALRYPHENA